MLRSTVLILAHQGGWDEILYLVIPAALALGAVRWAERRAKRRRAGESTEPTGQPTPIPQPDPDETGH